MRSDIIGIKQVFMTSVRLNDSLEPLVFHQCTMLLGYPCLSLLARKNRDVILRITGAAELRSFCLHWVKQPLDV